jgi:RNA polymerase sigma factor (TIGR02999 family)
MSQITTLLEALSLGDPGAAQQLWPLVYEELRALAAQKLAQEKPGQTLQPTALVHEAYLRLAGAGRDQRWAGRGHFFAAAAEAMRRILVENARRKKRLKHGGGLQRAELDDAMLAVEAPGDDVLAVDEALEQLAAQDSQTAELVKLIYFAGLTTEQAAEVLNISVRTAYRNWAYARAWLYRRLEGEGPPAR